MNTLRKMWRSKQTCLWLTGIMWVITIVVRFVLLGQQIPPADWVLWVVCNNLMIAGFAYQLGVLSFSRREDKDRQSWFVRGYRRCQEELSGSRTVKR